MTGPATEPAALDAARDIADAVLYEGYVLFPYRASATKNRYRWQWGVVVPHAQVAAGATEPHTLGFGVPVRRGGDVTVTARFLRLVHRQVVDPGGRPVDRVELGGDLHITWDEGTEEQVTVGPVSVDRLLDGPCAREFRLDAVSEFDDLGQGWHLRRRAEEVTGTVTVRVIPVDDGAVAFDVEVANTTDWSRRRAHRDDVLRRSLVGTHVLLSAGPCAFGSVVDPAPWAEPATDRCRGRGLYPVLVGDDDVVLAAPIILEDHPQVAPESPGPSFDGLEIDELLALCVRGLTDDEKREARATDQRAADIVDRSDALPAEVLDRLHGAVRQFGPADLGPAPEAMIDAETAAFFGVGEQPLDSVMVGDARVALGDTVRLHPNRRADAHDLFADGRVATVERIVRTVDDDTLVAVTLVDDPAADLHRWYGRFQYFHLDEVEPVTAKEAGT